MISDARSGSSMSSTHSLQQFRGRTHVIGILVAENTKLKPALSKSQETARRKAAEVEVLQQKLQALRVRNLDLERTFNPSTAKKLLALTNVVGTVRWYNVKKGYGFVTSMCHAYLSTTQPSRDTTRRGRD